MSYCITNIIAIRMGGVFAGRADCNVVKDKIAKVIEEMRNTPNIPSVPNISISDELEASKGSYVVIAGVFNYWTFGMASEFSRRLSQAFNREVVHTSWDEEIDQVQCQIFLNGVPLFESSEHPIGKILRRIQ